MSGEGFIRELPSPNDGLAMGGDPMAQSEAPASASNLLIAVRHHWKLVVAVWILTTAIAIPPIWLVIKPEYTATAQIKVEPIRGSVLDAQAQTIPMFDSFIASQALYVSTQGVLIRALDDPKVKNLPQFADPDLYDKVRENLNVAVIPKTTIIKVELTDQDRQAAVVLADAIINSYLLEYGGQAEIKAKLTFLNDQAAALVRILEDLKLKKLDKAQRHNATTDSMFESLRKYELEMALKVKEMRGPVDAEVAQLTREIEAINSGTQLGSEESDPVRQREAIETNPLVRSLQEQLLSESAALVRLKGGLTEDAPVVIEAKERIANLKTELDKARTEALAEFIENQKTLLANFKDRRLADLNSRLQAATARAEALAKDEDTHLGNSKTMGTVNIEINSIQEQMDRVRKELGEVEEARRKLEVERDQPGSGRVSKASDAEVLPVTGVKDKRLKLTGAAIAGCVFAALGVGFLRGRFDRCVYVPTQVESQTGLRILGVVPAIAELKRGRIAQEDFAEAYRLVRVNLLSPALGNPPKSILVTSAHASEGKTSLAVSLAVSLAELGGRVLLIDADTQAPQIGRLLSLDGPGRLRHVLSGEKEISKAAVVSRLPNLDVLLGCSNGNAVPRNLVDHKTVGRLIESAASKYDYVVVDSPPALGTADSIIWSQAVDSVVVSALVGYSDVGATRHLCDRLAMAGARVLGAVVCNVSLRSGSAYSSYSTSRSRSTATADQRPICMLPQMKGTQEPASS